MDKFDFLEVDLTRACNSCASAAGEQLTFLLRKLLPLLDVLAADAMKSH